MKNFQIYDFLKLKLTNTSRTEYRDISLTTQISGYFIIAIDEALSGSIEQSLKLTKHVQSQLSKYKLKNPQIISSSINQMLATYYIYMRKLGKAQMFMQAAFMDVQHHAPSRWTGQMHQLQGQIYDYMAHITPRKRSMYQEQALVSFTMARDQCQLYHPKLSHTEFTYQTLLYTLNILCITLDIPVLGTMNTFNHTDMLYKRLSGDSELSDTYDELTDYWEDAMDEQIGYIRGCIDIRLMQMELEYKNYSDAKQDLEITTEFLEQFATKDVLLYPEWLNAICDVLEDRQCYSIRAGGIYR